jgi:hypothetical protein
MGGGREFDRDKLVELVLFFSRQCEDDKSFDMAKLNKLLFLADFWAYAHLGQSITGSTYIHQEHGPTNVEFMLGRQQC